MQETKVVPTGRFPAVIVGISRDPGAKIRNSYLIKAEISHGPYKGRQPRGYFPPLGVRDPRTGEALASMLGYEVKSSKDFDINDCIGTAVTIEVWSNGVNFHIDRILPEEDAVEQEAA